MPENRMYICIFLCLFRYDTSWYVPAQRPSADVDGVRGVDVGKFDDGCHSIHTIPGSPGHGVRLFRFRLRIYRYRYKFVISTVATCYNVLPGGRKKVRCNDSTLYPDRKFSIT